MRRFYISSLFAQQVPLYICPESEGCPPYVNVCHPSHHLSPAGPADHLVSLTGTCGEGVNINVSSQTTRHMGLMNNGMIFPRKHCPCGSIIKVFCISRKFSSK